MASIARILAVVLLLAAAPRGAMAQPAVVPNRAADVADDGAPAWVEPSRPDTSAVQRPLALPMTAEKPATQPLPLPSPQNPLPPAGAPVAAASDHSAGDTALPLKPHAPNNRSDAGRKIGNLPSAVTVGGSLAAVLGVFFLVAWLLRRVAPRGPAVLPGDAFEVLGRAPLMNRQQVHLLRCGNKLLLVSVTPTGSETLTEITDREEVERLTSLCRQTQSSGATAAFRRVLEQLAAKRVARRQYAADEIAGLDLTTTLGVRRRGWEDGDV